MERFISRQGLRFKDFGNFVNRHSERIKQHARTMAEQAGRPYKKMRAKCDQVPA